MTERQEIKLRVACAALQGGMSAENVFYGLSEDEKEVSLWDIMYEIAPEHFLSAADRREQAKLAKDKSQSNTKVVY